MSLIYKKKVSDKKEGAQKKLGSFNKVFFIT